MNVSFSTIEREYHLEEKEKVKNDRHLTRKRCSIYSYL